MVDSGVPRVLIREQLGIAKSTLRTWISKHRKGEQFWIPKAHLDRTPARVGDVRKVLSMVDGELLDDDSRGPTTPIKQIERDTGRTVQTIRRWRDEPQYREATFEYDEAFEYDYDDLLDRAVVAQHLCSLTPDIGERLDLLMAVVGTPDVDEFSIPSPWNTKGRMT